MTRAGAEPGGVQAPRRGFLLGSAAALLLAGQAEAQAQAARGGVLRISVDQSVAVLNPLLVRVNPEYLVAELLYSGLTRLGPDMAAIPDLATSWSSSGDLKQWVFTLREKVAFHDGSPCTAKDVVASFEAMMDPRIASSARTNIGPVSQVDAVDDTTVRFTLSAPYEDLPVSLAFTNAKIVPAELAREGLAKLSRTAIGTGPFRLVLYEPDRTIVVVRNDAYFDAPRPYLDRVEVVVYPDPTAETSALLSGDTDLMIAAAASEYGRLAGETGVVPLRVVSGQFWNVNMGCDQKPFNDVRVRQALASTVDRDTMVGFVAQGYGSSGNDSPVNPAYRFYGVQPQRTANLAEAKRLLTEAGYPSGLDVTLVASDSPGTRAQLAVALQAMAKPAGFRIAVQVMPHATYLDQVWKKGSFYVGFYNMQATADAIFSLLYTSNAAWNETRWNNTQFDALVDAGRSTGDEAKRRATYAQAQELIHAQVPSVIPVFSDLLAARRTYVQGYVLHPRATVFRVEQVWLGSGAPKRA